MDSEELVSLEEKTRTIVDTLSSLEQEMVDYQKKNADITYAFVNLSDASGQVTAAGKALTEAAELFSDSDFSAALRSLDDRITQLQVANELLLQRVNVMDGLTEKILAAFNEISENTRAISQSLLLLPEIKDVIDSYRRQLDRIDKNTQKGFGKIKG